MLIFFPIQYGRKNQHRSEFSRETPRFLQNPHKLCRSYAWAFQAPRIFELRTIDRQAGDPQLKKRAGKKKGP